MINDLAASTGPTKCVTSGLTAPFRGEGPPAPHGVNGAACSPKVPAPMSHLNGTP